MEGQEGGNYCERYAWFKAVRSETSGEEEASRAARQRRDGTVGNKKISSAPQNRKSEHLQQKTNSIKVKSTG